MKINMEREDFISRVFRTRVSAMYILFFGAFIVLGWFNGGLKGFIIFGIISAPCIFSLRSTYYVLNDKEILVYGWGLYGKPNSRILISAITSVERSYSLGLASSVPIATLKRLRFRFREVHKFAAWIPMISPVREQEFLETLKALNPDIQINVNDKKGWWRFWDWDF